MSPLMSASTPSSDPEKTSTCFDLDAWEFKAGNSEFPPTLFTGHTTPEQRPAVEELPFIPTVCLSLLPPNARLERWQLAHAKDEPSTITPNHIIGAVVRIARGRTSPIASIDPATRRIRTQSGSVYELGTPDPAFHKSAPLVLRCLGF